MRMRAIMNKLAQPSAFGLVDILVAGTVVAVILATILREGRFMSIKERRT